MRRRIGTAVIAALMFWAFALTGGAAHAAVSSTPHATPQIGGSATSGTDGTVEVARQITQCGDVMYVGGRFTQVRNPNSTTPVARNNAFAFRATSPYTMLPWNPNVNGQVDTVACAPDGAVYIGGQFTTVGGVSVRNLAKVDGASGANQAAFTLHPAGRVAHVEVVRDQGNVLHLLVGGYAAPYLRSVNPLTGANDGYLGTITISGTYQYPNVAPHTTRIYNMTPYPVPYQAGATTVHQAILMTGVFTSVGGQRHEQIFRLNLTAGAATVSGWSPRELYTHCFTRQPFYAQDAAWSPDMRTIYTATTGLRTYEEQLLPSTQRPQERSGPCDAAIAYQATNQAEFDGHNWINYTGCDSLYSVAADSTTVFIGGHQRWIDNGDECDRNNNQPGRAQPGLGEINPGNGLSQPGPSKGRGLGATDLLRTSAGLWVGSDNQANVSACGTARSGRMGICFLPNG